MDSNNNNNISPPPPGNPIPPRRRTSRRSRWIGAAVALLVLAGTGWLAWVLTHPAKDTGAFGAAPPAASSAAGSAASPASASSRPAGSGAPGAGGPGSGSRGPGGFGGGTTVGVARAERADIPVTLDALGTVTPQASVKVRPQVSGVLQQVLFAEGQMVRAGELMATIDPRLFQLAVQQATGQRQRDEAQLESARVTLGRFNTLLGQDSIARQEVDTQAALVRQLEGTVMIDRANEGVAKLNLSYSRITAPVSGRVGLRAVDVGNVVSSSDANGVGTITQLAPIDVVFSVPQDRAGDLQQTLLAQKPAQRTKESGSRAGLKVTTLDRTRAVTLATGTLTSLDNQVDITTGTVRAKARFANTDGALFPNQFVNVRLLLSTIEGAVTVPVTALRFGDKGNFVYVLNASTRTVAQRLVKAGQATVDKVVITDGLKSGESVITEGADRLKDGATVVLPGDAPRGARRPASGASAAASDAADTGAGSGAKPSGGASGRAASAPAEGERPSGNGNGNGRRPQPDGATPSAAPVTVSPAAPASGS